MSKYSNNPASWISPAYFELVDPDAYTFQGFVHSMHSKKRSAQRNIQEEAIVTAIDYGRMFQKQGMRFFVAIDRDLPRWIGKDLRKKVHDLVVVVSGRHNEIITCYRTSNAFRYIRKKSCKMF